MLSRLCKILLLMLLAALAWQVAQWDFSFGHLLREQERGRQFIAGHPVGSVFLFWTLCLLSSVIPFPLAALLTMAAGTFFGLIPGILIALIGNTLGAGLAFLLARWLFGQSLRRRFLQHLQPIEEGLQRDGALFLFTMRLVPILPFFAVNPLMALTPLKAWTFLWVSAVGMIPSVLLYVNAGTQLRVVEKPEDLLSPVLWASFLALGLLPWAMKKPVAWMRQRLMSGSHP
ncbi:MAG: TVP38/TMEM64 family protein [Bdellovibrionaceae bacterium]|nr:TVP38/TMEM64 family protein [Pseudobdellovibrionaceae bacterium]MBX3033886.1 TVP38/TMEM64 family protein [Pseudobdellovibrionaceae bacterium]